MNAIKEIRLSLGLSQEEFAVLIGRKRTTISMIENEKNGITPELYVRINQIKQMLTGNLADDAMHEMLVHEKTKWIRKTSDDIELRKNTIKNLEVQLLKMKNEFASLTLKLEFICKEMQIFEATPNYKKKLEDNKKTTLDALRNVLPEHQQILVFQIELHKRKITFNESILVQLKNELVKLSLTK